MNILKHFLNIGFGSIINALLGFISTPLITRLVDPSVFGELTLFDSYSGIIVSFIFLGLDQALIRFFYSYESNEKKRKLLKFCLYIPLFFSIIVFIVLYILIKNNALVFSYSLLVFLFLFFNVFSSILQRISANLLRLSYQSKAYSFSVVVQKIVYCLVIVFGAIVIKDNYLEILILATILSLLASALVGIFKTKEYWHFNNNDELIRNREIIRYSLPMAVFAVLVSLLDSVDKMMINRFCTSYEVGVYTSAFTLTSMFALIQTTFNSIWQPAQTKSFTENPDDKKFIQKGNKYITLIMFFLAFNVIMFKDILCYLLGEKYRLAAIYMPFLIIEIILFTISDSTSSGIDYSKKSYFNIIAAAVSLAFSLILQLILVPKIGPRGSAIARAFAILIYFSIRTYISNKYYYIDYDLKKFYFVLFILIIFAFINTFNSVNIFVIFIYIVCLAIYFVIYYKDIKDLINYFEETLFKK